MSQAQSAKDVARIPEGVHVERPPCSNHRVSQKEALRESHLCRDVSEVEAAGGARRAYDGAIEVTNWRRPYRTIRRHGSKKRQ